MTARIDASTPSCKFGQARFTPLWILRLLSNARLCYAYECADVRQRFPSFTDGENPHLPYPARFLLSEFDTTRLYPIVYY